MGKSGIRRIAKIVAGAALAMALPAVVAAAAAFAQPAVQLVNVPTEVKVGDHFTVSGLVIPGDGVTTVTVTATGLDGRTLASNISSFPVDGATPTPFEVEFHASGLSGGALTITATATSTGGAGAVDRAQVTVTRGNSGR
jgi:hypothetical protein